VTAYTGIQVGSLVTQGPDFQQRLLKVMNELNNTLRAMLNRGLSFDDNVDCRIVSFTSNAVADTEDTVAHTLGKVPRYMIPVSLNKAAVVYKGATAWTISRIYVKTNAASTAVSLLIF
jgi:hypothetical protein